MSSSRPTSAATGSAPIGAACALAGLLTEVRQHDVRALLGEPRAQPEADAARAAGHDATLSLTSMAGPFVVAGPARADLDRGGDLLQLVDVEWLGRGTADHGAGVTSDREPFRSRVLLRGSTSRPRTPGSAHWCRALHDQAPTRVPAGSARVAPVALRARPVGRRAIVKQRRPTEENRKEQQPWQRKRRQRTGRDGTRPSRRRSSSCGSCSPTRRRWARRRWRTCSQS